MLAVAEKPGVVLHQLANRRLQILHSALHRRQQARVLRNVLHHARHHLPAGAGRIWVTCCADAACVASAIFTALRTQQGAARGLFGLTLGESADQAL